MKNSLLLSALIILFACSPTEDKSVEENPPIDKLFDSFYAESLELNPFFANFLGIMENLDTLPNNISDEYIAQSKELHQNYLAKLRKYDRESLSEDNQMNYDILEWHCKAMLAQDDMMATMLPINQFLSLNIQVTMQAAGSGFQPFNNAEDYNVWLKRLEDYSQWLDQALTNMQKGTELGYSQPKAITEKIIPQWQSLLNTPLEENIFFMPIQNMPDNISSEDSSMLASRYASMIKEELNPRYEKLINFFKNEYAANPRQTAGISSLPNGKAAYEAMLNFSTTTNLSPDSVFDLGMSEVKRIRQEMEKVKEDVGFEGDLDDFFVHVRTNPDLKPFSEPQEVIDNFNAIHERMMPQLQKLFSIKPETAFEVRRTEAFREKSAQAQYSPGNPDGSRPGVFYIPIPDVENYNTHRDEVLFLHEAIPGHHYQIMLTLEDDNVKDFRKFVFPGAYFEGWALYTESLGEELGLLQDPYQYFGMLSMEMHRAVRLVVDVGIHYKGWTREEAIQFSLDNESESEASIISEIERYMVWPGQATSYKIGQLTILALRKKAEEALAESFDLREFHTAILESGPLPMTLLERKIDKWIEEQKAS